MEKNTSNTYQNRIINANREQLLVITYEVFINSISECINSIEDQNEDEFNRKMVKVHRLHRELTDNLDMSYEISKNLFSLYVYMNKKLIEASMKLQKEPLLEVKKLALILLDGFAQVASTQSSDVIVKNAQKIYAGLTYGKGQLNETIMNGFEDRGFKA
jgi:flagellar protein FliS